MSDLLDELTSSLPPLFFFISFLPPSLMTSFKLSVSSLLFFSSLFLLRLAGRHNSRCLVTVLKTCLLHDGRLASPHLASTRSSFAVFFSSLSPPPPGSGGILRTRAIMLLFLRSVLCVSKLLLEALDCVLSAVGGRGRGEVSLWRH